MPYPFARYLRAAAPVLAVTAVLAGSSAAAAASSPTLVGDWPFAEGSGISAADVSGYGNTGTLEGGVQWVAGESGTALSFDGNTGRVQVPDAPSLEPSTVSVSTWVRSDGSPGDWKYLVAKGANGCVAAAYGLYTGPTGGLVFYVSTNAGTTYTLSPDAGPGVWNGQWHLVTGTYDGTTERLYVDGAQVGNGIADSSAIGYGLPDSNDLYFGYYPACGNTRNFDGQIDEPKVWAGALTPAAVAAASGLSSAPPSVTPTAPGQTLTAPGGGSGSSDSSGSSGSSGSGGSGSGGTASGGAGGTGGGGIGPANGVPQDTSLRLGDKTLRLTGGHATSTIVRYVDSQPALSILEVRVLRRGVLRGQRCVASIGKGPSGAACAAWVFLGSLRHRDAVGVNRIRFTGRISGRALAPGHYRIEVTPINSAGRKGATVIVRFAIVR